MSDCFPQPPDTLAALRRLVGDDNFPRVFGPFEAAPDAGPAPADSGSASDDRRPRALPRR